MQLLGKKLHRQHLPRACPCEWAEVGVVSIMDIVVCEGSDRGDVRLVCVFPSARNVCGAWLGGKRTHV